MDSKLLIVIAALALATTGAFMSFSPQATNLATDFESFKATHGKVYTAEEEAYRFAMYVQNKQMIEEHNASGKHTYTMAVNHLADLSHDEFKSYYLGLKPAPKTGNNKVHRETVAAGSVNWWTAGKVQAVKDQGQCGSCWAFSAVGSTESQNAINGSGNLESYAEQQLVDCDTNSSGCNGGWMDYGLQHFESAGICLESSYAYTATDGTCKESSCTKSSYTISSLIDVAAGSTSGLQSALDGQPISVAVDANNWSFYSGGVFSNCGTSLDHGVLAVAYDSSTWTIKNSWGASWGENGFIRLASGNTCGIANVASYPQA